MNRRQLPVFALSLCLLIIMTAVVVLLLPPRRTADFFGVVAAVMAHTVATAALLWILERPRGLLLTVGAGVTVAAYWLAAVGTALLYRLLGITAVPPLVLLEVILLCVAVLLGYLFFASQGYDKSNGGDG